MKISIITPSLNQGKFIERTIKSVLSQQFDGELEYWVIDGGSSDETIDILRKYESRLNWISEKDHGLADAVNKGLQRCTGAIIGWLNSDDLYLPGALARVAGFFSRNPEYQWAYGKCLIIDENEREIYRSVTRYKNLSLNRYSYKRLLAENYISQPAVFFGRSLINSTGSLDTGLKYAMDYNLWLRFGERYPAGVIPEYLSAFRRHSGSLSENYTRNQFIEQYAVAKSKDPGRWILTLHRFNIYKIIWGYRVLNLISKKAAIR